MPARPTVLALARTSVASAGTHLAKAWEGYRRNPAGDELHDLRVALRRATAAGALLHGFPAAESGDEIRSISAETRRRLSASRQAEVSAALLSDLLPRLPSPAHAVRLPSSYLRAPGPEELSEVLLLLDALSRWKDELRAWRPSRDERARLERKVGKRLAKSRGKLVDLGVPTRKSLHRQRVAGKALRYALELVEPADPGAARLLKMLRKLQDALGEANDWAALHEELRALRQHGDLDARRAARAASGVVKDERARHLDRARREARSARDVLKRAAASTENKRRRAS